MIFSIEIVKDSLNSMGFSPKDGTLGLWEKIYNAHDKYRIQIDLTSTNLSECKINYGSSIKLGRNTTTNFSQPENLVVLECLNRLLEKGYYPSSIELEKHWKVGGYADIFVKDNDGKAYLIIECKQWGTEYNRALKIILQNDYKKEQLFNYFLNEKGTKYLALYTSTLNINKEIIYLNSIICTDVFNTCNNQSELYEKWDKTFQSKGIFEESINPYNIKFLGLLKKDLKALDEAYISYKDSEGSIYNRFAEILRRHTISDKNNAYNKIFNLFLCKIVDEDNTSINDELAFQWKEGENSIIVLNRLNDLYKRGMKDYLKLDVADVTEEEFENELKKTFNTVSVDDSAIRNMFKRLRLIKNTEFAFKEIIDDRTFNENAEVAKEVIKLLEPYKIKYSHKQPLLGEFFERLLNIGVKQEAGQFFTPIPIASFICKSLNIEDIITSKIIKKDPNFLPYVIDYACGSGHFLTEIMERIDKVLKSYNETQLKTKLQIDNAVGWKVAYKWANEFIYGIEKDYRLVKTTKIASFLNGDGDANILYASGLNNFNSFQYTGKLKSNANSKDNPVFDVIIANPPYSVENFKFTLKDGKDSFDLYKYISDKSDDIECLFIERTKQLLKVGGIAGIILPSTILLNGSIHQKARDIIIKHFDIIGISEFGKNTFAATGQNTIVLFLRKRDDNHFTSIKKIVDKFLKSKIDFSFDNQEKVISQYIERIYPHLTFTEYVKLLEDKNINKLESIKLCYYLVSFKQKVVISHYGEKPEDEKLFLGYEHSDMRKYEGIHPYPYNHEYKINSMLYDNEVQNNPNKINTYIFKNFKGEALPNIPTSLLKHLRIKKLWEVMDFNAKDFKYRIYLNSLDNPYLLTNKYCLVTLSHPEVAEILDHLRKPVKKAMRTTGKYPYYGATGKTGQIDNYIFNEKLVLIGEDGAKWKHGELTAYIVDGKYWVNNHAHVIRPNKKILLHEYLVEIFCRLDFSYLKTRPNGGKLLKSDLLTIKFPLPSTIEQKDILSRISGLDKNAKYKLFDELLGIDIHI